MFVYNSLKRAKEEFVPLHEGYVGMYVCGPTVYSDAHLGNIRTFVSFDVIYRFLMYQGYKVRYVRNITDVGHLVGDVDTGSEDKISKRARLEKLEPMEIAQRYANGFHRVMHQFNALDPSIEPLASGHIIEQIEMVQKIIDNGYGYIVNGSVYFDTQKLISDTDLYGQLSGRKVEELLSETRDDLKNQEEKRHPSDFAIWIKASQDHLMRWPSPWSVGFPGWHLECSAMSTKYLGQHFDIHGGGNDLKFPHHENEVAQNFGACKCTPAKYWLHTNMLLMNGKKMSKSDGNHITPAELISGDSEHISKGYSPAVIRFFMLQSHYSSTLDLTDDALQAAEKGFNRLMEGLDKLAKLDGEFSSSDAALDQELLSIYRGIVEEMEDDFNTPKALAKLFELINKINSISGGQISKSEVSQRAIEELKLGVPKFVDEVFGLIMEETTGDSAAMDAVMSLIIDIRKSARENKDWALSDQIRDRLSESGIVLKDGKEGTEWTIK